MLLLTFLFVLTSHADHTFRTQCAVDVDAPIAVSDSIIDQLVYDFQYDFEHLFVWAFKGLGKKNDEKRDALLLQSKSISYQPEDEYGRICLDVIIPGFITIPNIVVEGIIQDERNIIRYDTNQVADGLVMDSIKVWSRHMYIEARKTGIIFDKAFGNLYIVPVSANKSIYFMDINFKFNWFLRAFISNKVYQNTIEWRVEQYMNNLKRSAEERTYQF